jgi:hypothetical protein
MQTVAESAGVKGTHEGEIKVFRQGDGAEAHMWKEEGGGHWEKIGDV